MQIADIQLWEILDSGFPIPERDKRRITLKLQGLSYSQIATQEGVSRQAIHYGLGLLLTRYLRKKQSYHKTKNALKANIGKTLQRV